MEINKCWYFNNKSWKSDRTCFWDVLTGGWWVYEDSTLVTGVPTEKKKNHRSCMFYKSVAGFGRTEEEARWNISAYTISGEKSPLDGAWELERVADLGDDWQ